jgi:hypothetical protein
MMTLEMRYPRYCMMTLDMRYLHVQPVLKRVKTGLLIRGSNLFFRNGVLLCAQFIRNGVLLCAQFIRNGVLLCAQFIQACAVVRQSSLQSSCTFSTKWHWDGFSVGNIQEQQNSLLC